MLSVQKILQQTRTIYCCEFCGRATGHQETCIIALQWAGGAHPGSIASVKEWGHGKYV